jgi:hypothetical protein
LYHAVEIEDRWRQAIAVVVILRLLEFNHHLLLLEFLLMVQEMTVTVVVLVGAAVVASQSPHPTAVMHFLDVRYCMMRCGDRPHWCALVDLACLLSHNPCTKTASPEHLSIRTPHDG